MTDNKKLKPKSRRPLSRQRILTAAIKIADKGGLADLSMRKLAIKLKVEAMSLYHHFAGKDEILDGMVDHVFEQIGWSATHDDGWQIAMQQRAQSLRKVLSQHPWAIGLLESRKNPGPSTLKHHNDVLDCLLKAGFSYELAAHSYALMDSYIYGFALQEHSLPSNSDEELQQLASEMTGIMPKDLYPALTTMTTHYFTKPGYSFIAEFEFGLELILDGLAAKKHKETT